MDKPEVLYSRPSNSPSSSSASSVSNAKHHFLFCPFLLRPDCLPSASSSTRRACPPPASLDL
eukprot:1002028-Pelagomonas_calceolata.AAC.8